MSQSKLPADPSAMILGIIALILGFSSCCCSGVLPPFVFLIIIPLLLSVIGLIMANKSLKEYRQNPEVFLPSSKTNVHTAKVINIIALIMSSIVVVVIVVTLIAFGALITSQNYDEILNKGNSSYEYEEDAGYDYEEDEDTYSIENDSLEIDEEEYKEIEQDTIINN